MSKRILLADDSLTIQKVVELTLAGTDYELTCVSNGQEALDALAALRPNLILADVVMPGKNGYEVCEAVKGNPATASIPVVLLSGTFEPFDRGHADRVGCDLVVSKPFDSRQLLGRIEKLLGIAPGPQPSFARQEEAPFETMSFDDALPSSGPEVGTDTENPFGRGDESPREQGRLTAGEGAQLEPVFLEESPAEASAESFEGTAEVSPEAQRHPVEDTPSPAAPAGESSPGEMPLEEISAEEAGILFDLPYEPEAVPPAATPVVSELTEEQIERIAARVVEKLSDRVVREIAWDIVPEMAEMVVKRRIKELESGAE
jgi:CheY-like chemotaxis protein